MADKFKKNFDNLSQQIEKTSDVLGEGLKSAVENVVNSEVVKKSENFIDKIGTKIEKVATSVFNNKQSQKIKEISPTKDEKTGNE